MTNEEQAAMLSGRALGFSDGITKEKYNLALEMAQWKDQQFAAEKQALIDKACEWWRERTSENDMQFVIDFRKAMENPKCTLKPFQKVLVRQTDDSVWECDIFSHIRNDEKYTSRYGCVGSYWAYCIPYEGNEALLGTTDNLK